MIGRGAIADPSIFRPVPLSPEEIHREYLRKCIECNNIFQNTKYTLLRMHTENSALGLQHPRGEALVKSKAYGDVWYIVLLFFLSTRTDKSSQLGIASCGGWRSGTTSSSSNRTPPLSLT